MAPWYTFSISSAFAEATHQALTKRHLKGVDQLFISFALSLFSIPWIGLVVLLGARAGSVSTFTLNFTPMFLWALLVSCLCYGLARVFFVRAVMCAPLSVTVPINAFTPVFQLITAWVLLGEIPGGAGFLGIFLIVCGSYVLNLNLRGGGLFAPFKALLTERGSRLMLLVALLWSVAPNFDKIGLRYASPVAWVLFLNIGMATLTGIALLFKFCVSSSADSPVLASEPDSIAVQSCTRQKKTSPSYFSRGVLAIFTLNGALMAVQLLGHIVALGMTLVTYASAVRRVNGIFGVMYGVLMFGESGAFEKLAGAVLMCCGAAVIIFR